MDQTKLFDDIVDLEICDKHEGKMKGMMSLSTSCMSNPCCLRNQGIEGSICQKCYAVSLQEYRKGIKERGDRNAALLTNEVIPMDRLPFINARVFRFEAFGDIYNATHLENYVNIAVKNPQCRFTLWTKNYLVALAFFAKRKEPDNFTLIISSLFLNQPQDITPFQKLGVKNLKVFTVYTKEYLDSHPTVRINCGGRRCLTCLRCYLPNDEAYVNEILKQDRKAYDKEHAVGDDED